MTKVEPTQAGLDAALKHLGWESWSDLCYWANGNDIRRAEELAEAFDLIAAQARAEEREACAKVAEDLIPMPGSPKQLTGTYAQGCFASAQDIRERGAS
jgi:hypothetical protein